MGGRPNLVGIQYLRAIAALAVLADHAAGMAAFPKYFGEEMPGHDFFVAGAMGVPLFFIISGFIIAHVSLTDDLTPRLSLNDYAWRRFTRIVPLMWIAIVSFAVLRQIGSDPRDLTPVLRALVLWPVGDVDPNVIWTLRHEALFYAVFAACFFLSNGARWLIALWVLSPLALAGLAGMPDETADGAGLLRFLFNENNLLFGLGLLIGLGLKVVRVPRVEAPWLLPLSIVYFMATMALHAELDLPSGLGRVLLNGLLYAPLVLACAILTCRANPVAMLLGNASFSIYLFHGHFESAALKVLSNGRDHIPTELGFAIVVVVSLLASLAVYRWIEIPLMQLFHDRRSEAARLRRMA